MTITGSELRQDIAGVISYGEKVRFRYYTISGADAGYDDDVAYTKSGTDLWVSGLVQPLDKKQGSYDSVLVEQGKLLNNDLRLYVLGTVDTSGTFQVGIGSANPPKREYAMIQEGVNHWTIGGEPVYKKIYLRYLTTGSITE